MPFGVGEMVFVDGQFLAVASEGDPLVEFGERVNPCYGRVAPGPDGRFPGLFDRCERAGGNQHAFTVPDPEDRLVEQHLQGEGGDGGRVGKRRGERFHGRKLSRQGLLEFQLLVGRCARETVIDHHDARREPHKEQSAQQTPGQLVQE